MELTSTAFDNHQWIPQRYTGAGENVSPPLRWSGEPKGCKGFAIICEDPDAPKRVGSDKPFIHWIVYNIAATVSALPEGILPQDRVLIPVSLDQGVNSFGKLGYGGPFPPIGHGTHRYHFRLYALRAPLGIPPGADYWAFKEALKNHVIKTAELTGLYEREAGRIAVV